MEYLHFAGRCLGLVWEPSNPQRTPCGWGVPQVCPRAAPGVSQPTPQTVLLLIINILPPQRGGSILIVNNTVWGVGWGTPGAALGHTRGSSGAPPTHRGLLGGCSAPQQPPKTPLQSVNIPPQLQVPRLMGRLLMKSHEWSMTDPKYNYYLSGYYRSGTRVRCL